MLLRELFDPDDQGAGELVQGPSSRHLCRTLTIPFYRNSQCITRFFRSGFNWVTGSGLRIRIRIQTGHSVNQKLRYCRGLHMYSFVFWHKFISDESASKMLINPPIVFSFTRQSWSSANFSSYSFDGVKSVEIKYTHFNSSTYFFHLATILYVWRA